MSSIRLSTLCILLALAAINIGCANDKKVIAQAETTNQGLAPAEFEDPTLNAYLNQIGRRIIAAAKIADAAKYGPSTHFVKKESNAWMFGDEIQFHLVNSATLNAFTTGGHHVYIYNALLQLCTNEDELAAVMAHEYGHIYCRHVAKGMRNQYGVYAAEAAGAAGGYAFGGASDVQSGASLGGSAGSFVNMGFTRQDEAQADETGFHFYHLAGWDPRQFGTFFQAMIDKGYDKTPAIESDHPTLKSRVEKANERVAELTKAGTIDKYRQPDIASPAQFKNYLVLAARLSHSTPDDKSLANSQQLLQSLPRSCVASDPNPPDAVEARQSVLKRTSP